MPGWPTRQMHKRKLLFFFPIIARVRVYLQHENHVHFGFHRGSYKSE